jgi:hypothetical protein
MHRYALAVRAGRSRRGEAKFGILAVASQVASIKNVLFLSLPSSMDNIFLLDRPDLIRGARNPSCIMHHAAAKRG